MSPGEAPADLQPFTPVGPALSTQRDIWLWFHGSNHDVVLDLARAALAVLSPVAELAYEQPAFVYLDSRDMTGFIDGTENPTIWEAQDVALIEDGPGEAGSHVLVMRFEHDLIKFHSLPQEEQEGVIGRTKPDSIELDDDVKPLTAHISRVVMEDENGDEIEIWRRSVPFGTLLVQGLQFVAFSKDPTIFTRMLERMYGESEDGLHDQLTGFTKPVTGSVFFAPSIEALQGVWDPS
jgi:putative iron-dependent peroxidase